MLPAARIRDGETDGRVEDGKDPLALARVGRGRVGKGTAARRSERVTERSENEEEENEDSSKDCEGDEVQQRPRPDQSSTAAARRRQVNETHFRRSERFLPRSKGRKRNLKRKS